MPRVQRNPHACATVPRRADAVTLMLQVKRPPPSSSHPPCLQFLCECAACMRNLEHVRCKQATRIAPPPGKQISPREANSRQGSNREHQIKCDRFPGGELLPLLVHASRGHDWALLAVLLHRLIRERVPERSFSVPARVRLWGGRLSGGHASRPR